MGLWAAERKRVIVLGTVADSERNDTPGISAFWGPHKGLKKMKMRNPRPFIYRFWISPFLVECPDTHGTWCPQPYDELDNEFN